MGEGMEQVLVRVHYPLHEGRLVLRSDADWEQDLEPSSTDPGESCTHFELALDAPYRYFKPILVDGERRSWSRGQDFLAIRGRERVLDLYPHFDEDSKCHVCDLHQVPSGFGDAGYTVRVWLPPGYDENPLESYPVLYMQDGQNLFFPGEAFQGEHWRVGETLGILESMNLVRRVIAVGVHARERERDYTMPGYEAYGRFLADELDPWVSAHYRTLCGPANRALLGSSLGGVVSLAVAWSRPDVFGNAGCLSSTFGWRDDLFERVLTEEKRPIRVYLDSGWPRDNYEVTRAMLHALRSRGFREGADLCYLAFPEAQHSERSWALRAHLPFQWFYRSDR